MYIHNIPHLPTYAMNDKLFYYKSKEREIDSFFIKHGKNYRIGFISIDQETSQILIRQK